MLKPTRYDWANVNRMLPSRKQEPEATRRDWGDLAAKCRAHKVDPRPVRELIKRAESKGESITDEEAIQRYLEVRR